jgi:hypothetical protein
MRLGRELPVEDLAEPFPVDRRPAQLVAGIRVGLLVHRQVRVALDLLSVGEAESFGATTKPPARRLPCKAALR